VARGISVHFYHYSTGRARNRTVFFGVDNFVRFHRKKACNMSKVSKFCIEKDKSCMSVHLNILCLFFINHSLHVRQSIMVFVAVSIKLSKTDLELK